MAITSLDQVLAGILAGISIFKPTATVTTGEWSSLWYVSGGVPAAGTGPASTASAQCDNTTTGAFPFTNPSGGRLSYVGRGTANSSQPGQLMIYDRLAHYGFANTPTGLYTMSSPVSAPTTRGSSGELWLEMPTVRSASASTVTVSYTNQAGTAARSTGAVSITTSLAANTMVRLPFQSGDTGAQSVASVTIGTNALAASGTSNIVILRQLAKITVTAAGIAGVIDAITAGLPRIYDSSCLAFAWMAGASTTGNIHADFSIAQG